MKKEADFPLLSDPTKEVATAYGVLNPRGIANRWTFYIGKDGRILAIDKDDEDGHVGGRHGGQARRAERREGELEP